MNLGPNQTRWLEALESGNFEQGFSQLCRGGAYCCLGVGAEIFRTTESREKNLDEVVFDGHSGIAPTYLQVALKLHSDIGTANNETGHNLVTLNDEDGLSFKEIAAIVRTTPEAYFWEPA